MTTLFDTSALLAALNPTEPYHQWSCDQLTARKADGPIVIVDIVYSELSVGMTKQQVDKAISQLALDRLSGNDDALFAAGKAYIKYRKQQGTKSNVLPDFLIGAAADVECIPLVTANPKDFVAYFPNVQVIKPGL